MSRIVETSRNPMGNATPQAQQPERILGVQRIIVREHVRLIGRRDVGVNREELIGRRVVVPVDYGSHRTGSRTLVVGVDDQGDRSTIGQNFLERKNSSGPLFSTFWYPWSLTGPHRPARVDDDRICVDSCTLSL